MIFRTPGGRDRVHVWGNSERTLAKNDERSVVCIARATCLLHGLRVYNATHVSACAAEPLDEIIPGQSLCEHVAKRCAYA